MSDHSSGITNIIVVGLFTALIVVISIVTYGLYELFSYLN